VAVEVHEMDGRIASHVAPSSHVAEGDKGTCVTGQHGEAASVGVGQEAPQAATSAPTNVGLAVPVYVCKLHRRSVGRCPPTVVVAEGGQPPRVAGRGREAATFGAGQKTLNLVASPTTDVGAPIAVDIREP